MARYLVSFQRHMSASCYVEADSIDGAIDIASMYAEDHLSFEEVDCSVHASLDDGYGESGGEG